MKTKQTTFRVSICLVVLTITSLAGCNATTPAKVDSPPAVLTGQQPIQGTSGVANSLLGYDFNRSDFDPSNNSDEPWRVSAKLTDSGDLLITNNNASPFSSSDKQNSYRFRVVNGEFVLQEYTHGYTGHSFGQYRVSHLFDLANHTYRKSDTERCDYEPQAPCPSAVTKRLGRVPTMTLQNTAYNKVDMVADLEKYVAK